MGRKNKLKRFADIKNFPNVFEPSFEDIKSGDYHLKGKWGADYFNNDNPIVLELGCGKGEYTLGLSGHFPGKNFIGIDIKGARMWVGAKKALEENKKNVGFLRTRIEFIEAFFDKNEVSEIWITFPDPQPKDRQIKNRLTHPKFLAWYKKFLRPEGVVHLKTDSELMHEYTREVIEKEELPLIDATRNLYGEEIDNLDPKTQDILSIRTYYENKFLQEGKNITYLKFQLN